MAKFSSLCSILGIIVGCLLLSIVFVYASTDQNGAELSVSPSLKKAPVAVLADEMTCQPGQVYRELVFPGWSLVLPQYCAGFWATTCVQMGLTLLRQNCTLQYQKQYSPLLIFNMICSACCGRLSPPPPKSPPPPPPSPPPPPPSPPPPPQSPPPPPPSPPPPPPSPPPPAPSSPPPPSPSRPPPTPSPTHDNCNSDGDTSSEITYPTSDCSYCTDWCRDECSDLGAKVVSNKCSLGESKFVVRCKCCCNENPGPAPTPPPSCPSLDCPLDLTWTVQGRAAPCKYKLESSPSLSSSSSSSVLSM